MTQVPANLGMKISNVQVKDLLDRYGAKGDTSDRVISEMWALGWVVVQGVVPRMRIDGGEGD